MTVFLVGLDIPCFKYSPCGLRICLKVIELKVFNYELSKLRKGKCLNKPRTPLLFVTQKHVCTALESSDAYGKAEGPNL